MSNRIYIPTKKPENWRDYLAEPKKHWRKGYSARALAYCWDDYEGFPAEFEDAFSRANLRLEKLLAIPEYKVYLDTNKAPSKNDLFVLARGQDGLYVIMVEGKVSEPFDKEIKDWVGSSTTRRNRLDFLLKKLEITYNPQLEKLHYQLLHRTVSAIIVAEQFYAKAAIMVVHSFSLSDKWLESYLDFVHYVSSEHNSNILGIVDSVEKDFPLSAGIDLYFGWIKGDEKYLSK